MIPFDQDSVVLIERLEEVKEKLEYVCGCPNHKEYMDLPNVFLYMQFSECFLFIYLDRIL